MNIGAKFGINSTKWLSWPLFLKSHFFVNGETSPCGVSNEASKD